MEKSWKDMKESPYYIKGYVFMAEFMQICCVYMQILLQILKQ